MSYPFLVRLLIICKYTACDSLVCLILLVITGFLITTMIIHTVIYVGYKKQGWIKSLLYNCTMIRSL